MPPQPTPAMSMPPPTPGAATGLTLRLTTGASTAEPAVGTLQVTMNSNLVLTAVFSDMPEIIADPDPETDPAPPAQPQPTNPTAPTSPPLTQYTLTVDSQGSGSTNPAPGMHQHTENAAVKLTAVPADGWRFIKWVIDGKDINNPKTEVNMDTNRMQPHFLPK